MEVIILGTIQDGGIPQLNCTCSNCKSPNLIDNYVASIGIKSLNYTYIVDCTPDISRQLRVLGKSLEMINGIFITHLHVGHYLGLAYLGKEAASSKNLPVYTTVENHRFFHENKPFKYLIERGEIEPKHIEFNQQLELESDLSITPIEIPHRNEDGNTTGLWMEGSKSLIYIPDLDHYTPKVTDLINSVDIAIIDGTFYSKNEISRQKNVPHPPITDSMDLFESSATRIIFTHFNHSNPVLDKSSYEYHELLTRGFEVATTGMIISL